VARAALDATKDPSSERTLPRRRTVSLRDPEIRLILVVGDVIAVLIASWAAPELWATFDANYQRPATIQYWQAASALLWILALGVARHRNPAAPRLFRYSFTTVVQASAGMLLLVLGLFYVAPFFAPRGSTFLALPLVAGGVLLWRAIYSVLLRSQVFDIRVAIVGTDEAARRTAGAILDVGSSPYRVRAFVVSDPQTATLLGVPVVGVTDDLWAVVQRLDVDQLVIGNTRNLSATMLNELVRCFDHRIEAVPATAVYEDITGRVLASALEADWYADLPTRTRGFYMGIKRLIDIVFAGVLFVATLPLMGVIGLVIWADSGRPIQLRQVRLGERGRPFVMHKFRTMTRDAESDGRAIWATLNDQRVTRVGRFLRRSRLDELPQLWDVVRGAMSLIGPRPERPEFVERLSTELPLFRARTLIRPGITGWAQVEYRYAGSIADNLAKLEFDLYYLRHLGPLIDLNIAIRTFFIVVRLRGQ
jgi:exopolysaccharide biosynthesis polyprenyl glycosylphosphotransferase